MDISHVASLSGNLGDAWAHSATEIALRHRGFTLGKRLEIRNGYFQEPNWIPFWEQVFVRRKVMIGPGAFLVPRDSIEKIGERVPFWDSLADQSRTVILHSVGIQDLRPLTEGEIQRARSFVKRLLDSERVFIGVRHDSHKILGDLSHPLLHRIPDAAFGIGKIWDGQTVKGLPSEYVAINVAGDQEDYRSGGSSIEWMRAALRFSESIDLPIVLVPHTTADFRPIYAIAEIADWGRRGRISVASLLPAHPGSDYSFEMLGVYLNASVIVANRYHSVIAGLISSRPTIAINNAANVHDLLESLGQTTNVIRVEDPQALIDIEPRRLNSTQSLAVQLNEFSEGLDCYYDLLVRWVAELLN